MIQISLEQLLAAKDSDMISFKCDQCGKSYKKAAKLLKTQFKNNISKKTYCSTKCQKDAD